MHKKYMETHPDAKIADIKITEVPYQWNGLVPSKEIGAKNNSQHIKLIHEPTGITFEVNVPEGCLSKSEIATLRAEAKLEFIHTLHGNSK